MIQAKDKTKKPTWLKVKSSIGWFDKAKLIELLRDLYNLSEDNKDFLNARLSLIQNPTDPYKKIIRACLYPDIMEDEGFEYDKAEQAIWRYGIACGTTEGIADLMIYFVECGNKFTLDYGDINETFYDTMIEMYGKAVRKVLELPKNKQRPFRKRLREIMESAHGIGWGYHDDLCHLHYDKLESE
jgi:hypothetical protein